MNSIFLYGKIDELKITSKYPCNLYKNKNIVTIQTQPKNSNSISNSANNNKSNKNTVKNLSECNVDIKYNNGKIKNFSFGWNKNKNEKNAFKMDTSYLVKYLRNEMISITNNVNKLNMMGRMLKSKIEYTRNIMITSFLLGDGYCYYLAVKGISNDIFKENIETYTEYDEDENCDVPDDKIVDRETASKYVKIQYHKMLSLTEQWEYLENCIPYMKTYQENLFSIWVSLVRNTYKDNGIKLELILPGKHCPICLLMISLATKFGISLQTQERMTDFYVGSSPVLKEAFEKYKIKISNSIKESNPENILQTLNNRHPQELPKNFIENYYKALRLMYFYCHEDIQKELNIDFQTNLFECAAFCTICVILNCLKQSTLEFLYEYRIAIFKAKQLYNSSQMEYLIENHDQLKEIVVKQNATFHERCFRDRFVSIPSGVFKVDIEFIKEIFDCLITRVQLEDRENYEPFFVEFNQNVVPTVIVLTEDADFINKSIFIDFIASVLKFIAHPGETETFGIQISLKFEKGTELYNATKDSFDALRKEVVANKKL